MIFTQCEDGEFIITTQEPKFNNIHGFIDEVDDRDNDAFEQLAEEAKRADSDEVQPEWNMREVRERDETATTERDRLLKDFGVSYNEPELCQEDHTRLRNDIARAKNACDEVTLSEKVDAARSLGPAYKW